MDKAAITKARHRIATAQNAILAVGKSKNHDEFNQHWYVFLVAFKNIYTSLEKGSKVSAQSRQWFGGKKAFRRSDELLQYLYQARGDAEHGLGEVSKLVPRSIGVGTRADGYSSSIELNAAGGRFVFKALDNKPILVTDSPAHSELSTVHGRGKDAYPPPRKHKGLPIPDPLPIGVANLAMTYMVSLVDEAAALA